MLSESVVIADSITSSPVYAPWSILETACLSQVITDLRACWDRVVLRRRTAKDTSERWYHGGTLGAIHHQGQGCKFHMLLKRGAWNMCQLLRLLLVPLGQAKFPSSHSKRTRKFSRFPMKLPRRIEISSPPASPQRQSLVEDPSFASALAAHASHGKWRRSRRDRRAAPVFQMGLP